MPLDPGSEAPRILVVEDDDAIASGVALNLRLEGYVVLHAADGERGLEMARVERPALILLDITLPKKSGLDLLRELREGGDAVPVIVLSARQDEFDKVAALRSGADDYVTKPFSVAELLARIDALLRRATPVATGASVEVDSLGFDDVEIDETKRVVRKDGVEVTLTHLEFELLVFLVRNGGQVFSREDLLRRVWGSNRVGSVRTVDNFVAQLRSKLEGRDSRHFVTVRGSGYRFDI